MEIYSDISLELCIVHARVIFYIIYSLVMVFIKNKKAKLCSRTLKTLDLL